MKALSNFNYDLCHIVFGELVNSDAHFKMGYFGKAMCGAQLIWGVENVAESLNVLNTGKNVTTPVSTLEEGLFDAALALNDLKSCRHDGPITPEAVESTRECRYDAFLKQIESLDQSDENVRAYMVLANMAMASLESACSSMEPGKCAYTDKARLLASQWNAAYSKNPALLHYALHAFDVPDYETYTEGLVYAENYPTQVNNTVHSLHMPSHIFDRAGQFNKAARCNQDSINAADFFSSKKTGALSSHDGPVGDKDNWLPGTNGFVSGKGFAYNAANLYHSLEYLHYETLNLCDMASANAQLKRMSFTADQALQAGMNTPDGYVNGMDMAWRNATMYFQWLYRMESRHIMNSIVFSENGILPASNRYANLMKSVDNVEVIDNKFTYDLRSSMPLHLSWNESPSPEDQNATGGPYQDNNHAIFSPQSEALLWTAIGISTALNNDDGEQKNQDDFDVANDACIGLSWIQYPEDVEVHGTSCNLFIVQRAIDRVQKVIEFYKNQGLFYEGNLTLALREEIISASFLSVDDFENATKHSALAEKYVNVGALCRSVKRENIFSLSLSLSLSHTHTHTHINNTDTKTMP